MKTIPQIFINLASDRDIDIPRDLDKFEIIAASSTLAATLATASGKTTADRHDFIEAVSRYLTSLPSDDESAKSIIARDASSVLGIPAIASEHSALEAARRAVAEAQISLDAAELERGRTLARIYRLEREISDLTRDLENWKIDFEAWQLRCESAIVEFYAKPEYAARVNSELDQLARIPHLRRLAPPAIAKLEATIAAAEAELKELRETPPAEPARLSRGKQLLTS